LTDRSTFTQVYLKEIGVHTPISCFDAGQTEQGNSMQQSISKQDESHIRFPEPSNTSTLSKLERDVSACTRCVLSQGRTQTVFGVGKPDAEVLLIGEAPVLHEDEQGKPFVGTVGNLLDRMLQAIELERSQIYVMNIVKCRPPNNRDPLAEEVEACAHWFDQQVRLIAPKVICLLGRVAAQAVLKTDAPLGQLREQWHDYHGIPVYVVYHPAFLLRSPGQKQKAWSDLQALKLRLLAVRK